MKKIKIVVAGPYGAGKTRFINTASEIETVSTEVDLPDQTGDKKTTTVAMDYGRLTISEDIELNMFGTPGQDRLGFMWEILSLGMKGLVFVVDSNDEKALTEAARMLPHFSKKVPVVVAANKQDQADPTSVETIRKRLSIDESVPVIPCAAIEKESVLNVLETLTDLLDAVAV